jgi:hypothetical protein
MMPVRSLSWRHHLHRQSELDVISAAQRDAVRLPAAGGDLCCDSPRRGGALDQFVRR